MSDVLISRLANCRAMAAGRLPAPDVEAIDLAIAEIAELKEAYASLFKAHGAEQLTVDRLHDRLRQIGDRAHDASTGPAVPDVLWEIRSMAYDGIGA